MRPAKLSVRLLAVLVAVVALVGASCVAEKPSAPGPAPEPTPAGAAYGRVMRAGGTAVPKADIGLWQYESADAVRSIFAGLSIGFFCFIPTDAFCPKSVGTSTDELGAYSFGAEDRSRIRGSP